MQFQHSLDQMAEARRTGAGADTEALDANRLTTLLSVIGTLLSSYPRPWLAVHQLYSIAYKHNITYTLLRH